MIRAGSAAPLWVALGVAALLYGCSSRSDLEQLSNNQFELRGMVASDRQRLDVLEQDVRRLSEQIREFGQASQGGGGGKRLDTLEQRLGRLEDSVRALPSPSAAAPPGGAPGTSPSVTPPMAPAPGEAPPGGSAMSTPPPPLPKAPDWHQKLSEELNSAESRSGPGAKLYRAGLEAMDHGDYPHAISRFRELQHRYPKSPLSEPAEYFAANALYETGKYDQAILQFNDLVMRFPNSRFVGSSLLGEAQAFVKINDKIDARLTLQKLLADHGDAPEADQARQVLKELAS
jgi:tol-pal system protein YbgF